MKPPRVRFSKCKRCGMKGALHRGPETGYQWELYPAVRNEDGTITPILRDESGALAIHRCGGSDAPETEETDVDESVTPPPPADPLAAILAQHVAPLVKAAVDPDKIARIVDERVKAAMAAIADAQATTLRVSSPTGDVIIEGQHRQTGDLLYWISERIPVLLFGKPGGAKTHTAAACAKALGLKFGYISLNPQTPESRLFGFPEIHTTGTRRTTFRDCYEHGGVYLIDEIDNASPALLTSLNGALANGHCAFPDGLVDRHPDFVVVATANTAGRGGSLGHAERRPLDAATIDRFAFEEWQYDEALELRLALARCAAARPWVAWVQQVRRHCAERHPQVVVSPRASMMGAQALQRSTFSVAKIADSVLFKHLDPITKGKILAAVPLPAIAREASANA